MQQNKNRKMKVHHMQLIKSVFILMVIFIELWTYWCMSM